MPYNNDLESLFKVRKTAIKTLEDRGYELPAGLGNLSFDDFKLLHEKDMHHLHFPDTEPIGLEEENKKGGGIFVYFESSDKFDTKVFLARKNNITQEHPNLDKLFFVLKTYGNVKSRKLNSFVKAELVKHPNVEILENIFPFDFMKNAIVPECHLLTEEEKEAIVSISGTPSYKFPKMEQNDPIAVRFGAKIGDILYIKRNGGLELSYRVIVKSSGA